MTAPFDAIAKRKAKRPDIPVKLFGITASANSLFFIFYWKATTAKILLFVSVTFTLILFYYSLDQMLFGASKIIVNTVY